MLGLVGRTARAAAEDSQQQVHGQHEDILRPGEAGQQPVVRLVIAAEVPNLVGRTAPAAAEDSQQQVHGQQEDIPRPGEAGHQHPVCSTLVVA
mgnify:FL=1